MTITSQVGVKDEATYGAGATVDRFYEFESEGIEADNRRMEGDYLHAAGEVSRSDRSTPWHAGAGGSLKIPVMSKGFGWWLKHMLGPISTSAPGGDGEYTHSAVLASTLGEFFAFQSNRKFYPTDGDHATTYNGGKVTGFDIGSGSEGVLMASLDLDFMEEVPAATAPALAAASYPAGMEELTWIGASCTIDGTELPVDAMSFAVDLGLNTGRHKHRDAGARKLEPARNARPSISWKCDADWDSRDHYARTRSEISGDNFEAIVMSWRSATAIGGTVYPTLTVTMPAGRFDEPMPTVAGVGELSQSLGGPVLFDGSTAPITVAYTSVDATP